MSAMVYPNAFLCIFKVYNNLPSWCALSLGKIITRKVSFSLKNEYFKLNGNGFKSGFGGWTLEGMDSVDCGDNSSIYGLQLHAFASSWK